MTENGQISRLLPVKVVIYPQPYSLAIKLAIRQDQHLFGFVLRRSYDRVQAYDIFL
jgi:hypothetical protein